MCLLMMALIVDYGMKMDKGGKILHTQHTITMTSFFTIEATIGCHPQDNDKDGDDDDDEDGDGDDDDIAREKAGRGKGVRLPSIIPTIQALSVFLAKGNFIPKDFFKTSHNLSF